MDLAFDHHRFDSAGISAQGLPALPGYGVESARSASLALPDWAGIKARFLAAHALRRELAHAGAEPSGGSFAGQSRLVLATGRLSAPAFPANCSQAVNPTASANGKCMSALPIHIAGNPDPASEDDYD